MGALSLALICMIFLQHRSAVTQDIEHDQLCRLFKDGVVLRKPGSCDEYIECRNGLGEIRTCTAPQIFDDKKQSCAESNTRADDSYCRNRCEGINGKWVADPASCQGYLYCDNGTPLLSACDVGKHFDETKQQCIDEHTSSCIGAASICETVPDKTTFRDENDCTAYYECSGGKRSRKTCKSTYYDPTTGNCVEKSLVDCTAHPRPTNVCGTAKKPFRGFKPDGATCRGHFMCRNLGVVQDLEPVWGQCEMGKFFNSTSQLCVEPMNAICTYNRCEGRGNRLVASSKNDCHNYIECVDGVAKQEKACSGDRFFDEQLQACVSYIIDYPCCDGRK